jgi:hypothetical protein
MADPKRRTSSSPLPSTNGTGGTVCGPQLYIQEAFERNWIATSTPAASKKSSKRSISSSPRRVSGFQWKTIPQGAATSVWAAVVAPADQIGGRYCENCHVGQIVPDHVTITAISEGVRGYALDTSNAEALWKKVRNSSESRSSDSPISLNRIIPAEEQSMKIPAS